MNAIYTQLAGSAQHELSHSMGEVIIETANGFQAGLKLFYNEAICYDGNPAWLFGELRFNGQHDVAAINALLAKAAEVSRDSGAAYLLGPMDGSTWRNYRVPLAMSRQFLSDVETDTFWAHCLLDAGFRQADKYFSAIAPITECEPISAPGLTIRPFSSATFAADLKALYPLCMAAFRRNAYFSPISENAFLAQYSRYAPLLQSGLSFIAFDRSEMAGFLLAFPDSLYPAEKRIVVKTVARHPHIEVKGLGSILLTHAYAAARRQGAMHAIHALMHERNISLQRSEEWGATVLSEYALFVKQLDV